eukprot:gene58323-biopygen26406
MGKEQNSTSWTSRAPSHGTNSGDCWSLTPITTAPCAVPPMDPPSLPGTVLASGQHGDPCWRTVLVTHQHAHEHLKAAANTRQQLRIP